MNNASRPSLRVTIVTETFPPEINGVAMTLGKMVNGLVSRGHQIQVVRPAQKADSKKMADKRIEEIRVFGLPIPRYGGLKFGLPALARLLRAWKIKRPDLVHVATEGPLGWSAVTAARILGLPVTSGFHTNFDSYSGHYGIGWLRNTVTAYLRHFHNKTLLTLVPTRAMADTLAAQGYKNLQVSSRGVDSELFHPRLRCRRLRQNWGIQEGELAVIYVGRLAPEKNLQLLQESFSAIRRVRPDARLILIGDGPDRQALEARNPDYYFCGMRTGDDLAAHYASGDLFLFPSVTETFGNVVLEAMASGLPVLAYNYAAAAELIQDGLNGRVAPLNDAKAFTERATEMVGDAAALAALGAAAREKAGKSDWVRIHDDLESLFVSVVQNHGKGSGLLREECV